MFQEFVLFPHQNVAENIAFGLRMAGGLGADRVPAGGRNVGFGHSGRVRARSIFELSGGERQRVALARSLAPARAC